jgi:hypothetical protein
LRPVNCSGLPRERKATPRRACDASSGGKRAAGLGGREVYRVSRCGRVPGPVQELVARGRTAILLRIRRNWPGPRMLSRSTAVLLKEASERP